MRANKISKIQGRSPTRGFTLTEVAIVLGIIGIILGAIWGAASKVYQNRRTSDGIAEITSIVNGVRATWSTGKFDVGPTWLSALAVNNGIIPTNYLSPCTTAGFQWGGFGGNNNQCGGSPWNAQIMVGTQTGVGGAAAAVNRFEILIGLLKGADCSAFMTQFIQQAKATGLTFAYTDTNGGVDLAANANAANSTTFAGCGNARAGQGDNIVLQFTL